LTRVVLRALLLDPYAAPRGRRGLKQKYSVTKNTMHNSYIAEGEMIIIAVALF
jgi:hypothetical protein